VSIGLSSIKLRIIYSLGIYIFLGMASLSVSHALEIKIKDRATVRGDKIYLGEISSFDPADDGRIKHLSGIEVSSAPFPGNVIQLSRRFLNYKIGSAIPDKEGISLSVPGNLVVERTAQVISAEQLEDIFKEHVIAGSPWRADQITFERINTPGPIALPEGELRWNVTQKGNQQYLGNMALVVNFRVDERPVRKVPLSGKITVIGQVVKAAKRIRTGQLICEGDVVLVEESNDRPYRDVLASLDEAIGKRAVRNIQPSQSIRSRMIEFPPLVRKGERVVVRAESELIRATTVGKALEDGRSGDQVKVINISSGKELLATVKGSALVEVSF
jgi:flagella basal body P-ring formation protein FlgA